MHVAAAAQRLSKMFKISQNPILNSTQFVFGIAREREDLLPCEVKPEHDIISRIDLDRGNSVVTPCEGRAYQCHSIYRTLWNIFELCGSMTHKELKVPCGWSEEAPC